jgi:hypothetical protein
MKISEFDKIKKFGFLPNDENTNDVRLRELEWLAPYLSEGGYNLEFGVFSGTTINALASHRPDLHFNGFDSFSGLPEDWDMGEKNVSRDAFDRKGVLPEVEKNVTLWKGWFDETIPVWLEQADQNKPITYLHIDCDLYSSTVTILENLNHMIKPGTFIRWDELSCWRNVFGEADPRGKAYRVHYTTWKDHEWKAMNEWMEKYNRKVIPVCRNWFQGATVMVTQ